jgi:tetratricopeptide (TPR) repeat protein
MVVVLKKIALTVADLIFRRAIILFLLAAVISGALINQHSLKLKTLNYLLPSENELRLFVEHPRELSRDQLKTFLVYYQTVCDFVKKDPEEPAPCSMAGYAHYYLGNEKKALRSYQRSCELNDRFFWFFFNLGAIYYNQERYAEAADAFAKALGTPTDHAAYFFMLTKTYREISRILDVTPEEYEEKLNKGYDLAKQLLMISQLMVHQPEIRERIQRKYIELHLF